MNNMGAMQPDEFQAFMRSISKTRIKIFLIYEVIIKLEFENGEGCSETERGTAGSRAEEVEREPHLGQGYFSFKNIINDIRK